MLNNKARMLMDQLKIRKYKESNCIKMHVNLRAEKWCFLSIVMSLIKANFKWHFSHYYR